MSAPLFTGDVLFYQRLLKSSGYYNDILDGVWGNNTTFADKEFLDDSKKLKTELGDFDQRTEGHIATMHIKAQRAARMFMNVATSGVHRCQIISGTRSYKEQNELYKQGRWGNPGPRVTNARGGQSNHNFCIAWDIGLFDSTGTYLTGSTTAEIEAYKDIAAMVDMSKIEWGGDWTSFKDRPHYQYDTNKTTAEVRALFEAGNPYI
tara:strand:+ start:45 stop:662 length:618 start_codon:yes stop_codon:yes gene_type:complete